MINSNLSLGTELTKQPAYCVDCARFSLGTNQCKHADIEPYNPNYVAITNQIIAQCKLLSLKRTI